MKKKVVLFIILIALILSALAGGIFFFVNKKAKAEDSQHATKEEIQDYIDHFNLADIEFQKIPASVFKYSKKLQLFDEVFSSDKVVIVYGYEKGSRIKYISEKFHKQMQKDLAKNGLDKKYEVITISKPESRVNDVMKKNHLSIPEEYSPCDLKDGDMKGVLDIVDIMSECYSGMCLVDSKKKVYLPFTKEYPEIILKLLQEYK